MHIGIAGPCSTLQLEHILNKDAARSPKGLGGTPVNNLVSELVNLGHQVSLFSLSPDVEQNVIKIADGKNLKVYFGRYRTRARDRALDIFKEERKSLAKMINIAQPSLIHAHWQYEFAWPAIDSSIPTMVTCHDVPFNVLLNNKTIYRSIRLAMAYRNISRSKHVNAVSPYAALGNQIFTKKKISIVPNFEPKWVFDLGRERVITDKPRIAMVNNDFSKLKNVETGLKAFNRLLNYYPKAELSLFGREHGNDEAAYFYCKRNNILKNVNFVGALPFKNLISSLSECDLLLHTSFEESCPMVLIEAMALGIPVVGGIKSGGVPWMLENGGGILTDVKKYQVVCDTIINALNPETYSELSIQALRNARRFHPEVVIKQYLQLYTEICQ